MIAIIKGCGSNIASLLFALERLGVEAELTDDPQRIQAAEKVILPGVGCAANAMRALEEAKLVDVIRQLKQPVLGICLGMQLLYEFSEEGNTSCLGIVPGNIKQIPNNNNRIVPHMGWNQLRPQQESDLLASIDAPMYLYFVHSYAAPVNAYTLAVTDYGDQFTALVQKNNFYGAQFHPEKSGNMGLQILNNFVRLAS